MLAQLLLCILIADFLSGLIHWWEDTYGLPSWPILGRLVIEPNIEHHEHPGWIGYMGTVFSRNVQPAILTGLVVVAWLIARAFTGWTFGVDLWQILLTGSLVAFANEVHGWSHRPASRRHWLVTMFQEMGVLQSPEHHAGHHRPPYDQRFCVLTNWLNPVLDRVRFWRGLEWLIARVFKTDPKRGSAERRGV